MSSIVEKFKAVSAFKFSLIICTLFFSAYTTASEQENSRLELKQVYSKIGDLLSDKRCVTSSDCGALPVGNKACGGPSTYKVYSKLIGDDKISQLQELAQHTKQLDNKRNDFGGIVGTCVFISEPALVCENSLCVIDKDAQNSRGLKTEIR